LDSTQDEARRLAKTAKEWTVIVAESQWRGRGKPGRVWYSPVGGLYFSVILKPRKNLPDLLPLTKLAAQAVISVIKRQTGLSAQIKFPNDVLLNGKKICGILTEKVGEAVIIGIGLNLNIAQFPPELSATSLWLESKRSWDTAQTLSELLDELKKEYVNFLGGYSSPHPRGGQKPSPNLSL